MVGRITISTTAAVLRAGAKPSRPFNAPAAGVERISDERHQGRVAERSDEKGQDE